MFLITHLESWESIESGYLTQTQQWGEESEIQIRSL